MNKTRIMKLCIILLLITIITGCKKETKKIDTNQIKEIAELATLQVVYHDVAIVDKAKKNGITNIGEIDRKQWIEYTGIIEIGFNADDVKITPHENNKIEIEIPKPEILPIDYKDYNEDSFYQNKDSFWNKNEITHEDVNYAMKESIDKMKKQTKENKDLLRQAQTNLKQFMENYIKKVGEISGIEYDIECTIK